MAFPIFPAFTKLTAAMLNAAFSQGVPVGGDVSSNTVVPTGATTPIALAELAALQLGEAINPCSPAYGADPTGTVDSSSAFTAAMAAGPIFAPPGTYLFSAHATIPAAGATVIGVPGKTIFKMALGYTGGLNGTKSIFQTAGAVTVPPATSGTLGGNLYISGVTFDLSLAGTSQANGAYVIGWTKVALIDCTLIGGSSLIQGVAVVDVEIRNPQVSGTVYGAALDFWAGSQGVRIFGGNLQIGGVANAAVQFNASDGAGTISRTASGLKVVGVAMNGPINLDTLGSNQYIDDVLLFGNTIANQYGIFARGQMTNCRIIGNDINVTPSSGNSVSQGIWVDQGAAAGSGYTGNPNNTQVVGNSVYGFVGSTENAIQIYGQATVIGNLTEGAYNLALQLTTGGEFAGNCFPNGAYGSTVINNNGVVSANNINAVNTATLAQSTLDGATATGTNLATAVPLTAQFTSFNTVAPGTGCALPGNAASAGQDRIIYNSGASTLTIYAQAGDTINYAASATVAQYASFRVRSLGNGLWRVW